jgi:caa(3)-type oxidase subunit IV
MSNPEDVNRTPLFVGVFVVLVLLTLGSFGVANIDGWFPPPIKWQVMLGISAAKAALVVLFFMHFWWERSWKYLLTIPTVLMAVILVVALVPDIMNRRVHYNDIRLNHSATSQPAESAVAAQGQGKP